MKLGRPSNAVTAVIPDGGVGSSPPRQPLDKNHKIRAVLVVKLPNHERFKDFESTGVLKKEAGNDLVIAARLKACGWAVVRAAPPLF